MTHEELKLDYHRSWLLALAMLRCDRDIERAVELYEKWRKDFAA